MKLKKRSEGFRSLLCFEDVFMSLLKPDKILKRITEITPDLLKELGVDSLLLDVDNTLSTHHGTVLVRGLKKWLLFYFF